MKVIYTDAVKAPDDVEKSLTRICDMNSLLAESILFSLHVPLMAETRGLFDSPKLPDENRRAFLIHVARARGGRSRAGGALDARKIAGAALDVYENEPFIHPG